MSWQAQTAVTHHSKQTSIKRLRLLLYLAENADSAGAIDPAPNQETLADFLDCTSRTIRTHLNELEASGELKQTRVGSGPGNPSAYQITLPIPENGREGLNPEGGKAEKEGGKAEENPGFASTFEAFKAETKAEINQLKAEINQLKAEILEPKGGKVEAERRKGHSFKSADDPSLIQFDPNKKHIYAHPLPAPVEELITAIAQTVKTAYGPGVNEDDFEAAAYTLLGWEVDPARVTGFSEWWDVYGYYPGKPALKSFLDEFRNYLSGVRPSANGRSSPAPVPKTNLVEIEPGLY